MHLYFLLLVMFTTYVEPTSVRLDGDISIEDVIADLTEPSFYQIKIHQAVEGRNALKSKNVLWPDAKIPYIISRQYDDKGKSIIAKAMAAFHNHTCIRFTARKQELSYISISPGKGCFAVVGRLDEHPSKVSIGRGCYIVGIAIHELMHSLGFLHEHSRPDRDEFVDINFNNVLARNSGNFKKRTWGEVQNLSVAYDYDSIMHYGRFDFAVNKTIPTIVPLKGDMDIGQRRRFSDGDLLKINRLYNCTNKL